MSPVLRSAEVIVPAALTLLAVTTPAVNGPTEAPLAVNMSALRNPDSCKFDAVIAPAVMGPVVILGADNVAPRIIECAVTSPEDETDPARIAVVVNVAEVRLFVLNVVLVNDDAVIAVADTAGEFSRVAVNVETVIVGTVIVLAVTAPTCSDGDVREPAVRIFEDKDAEISIPLSFAFTAEISPEDVTEAAVIEVAVIP